MRTLLSGPFPYIIAAILLAIGALWFLAAGSVIVVDETGSVKAAYVVNSGSTKQRLRGPVKGYFFGLPHMEGTVEVHCSNRVRKQGGYVTGGVHAVLHVVGRTPCERLLVVY